MRNTKRLIGAVSKSTSLTLKLITVTLLLSFMASNVALAQDVSGGGKIVIKDDDWAIGVGGVFGGGSGGFGFGIGGGPGLSVEEGDDRICQFNEKLFALIEGNLGALVMITAGLFAIISAAFGAYKMGLGLLVVAIGAFILRSLVAIFFNACFIGY